jgi:non-specific serine/threonine protein kinase
LFSIDNIPQAGKGYTFFDGTKKGVHSSRNVCIIEPESGIPHNAQSDTNSDTNDQAMTDEIHFGEWLRKQRRSLDLTQRALAAQAGCAEITLRRIEDGTLKPSKELAFILLEKLGVPQMERPQWMLFARGLSGFPTSPIDSSASQPLTNLPAPLTTFIGREKEQAEIIKLTRKHRLATLTGPGGVGKTRLSIQVGEQVLADYANGVWLIELASLNDPALLPQTVMALFGLVVQANTSPTENLINFLRAKTSLLILDNCEHLLDVCARLADTLLKSCPSLKILATSREALGISGEAAYPVPSLGLPDLGQLLENFKGYESVRLFEERAQLAKMDFSLTLDNASSVAQICQRLDGIPLAIELAAAQVNKFSADQIATKLIESFNLLTGGSRTALPRQQTIRASIEWSWNLLSDSERILLRRLSVFAGGWILESAEAVCSENGTEKNQVADLLSQLVAKSLVVANRESRRERRYHLLETIRQYADEKLVEAAEKETIRIRHLEYFLKLSEEIEPGLSGPQQVDWFARTSDELYDLRAALEWAAKTDVEAGLSLASRLGQYWISFDYSEGARWLAEFLQNPQAEEYPKARVNALIIQGHILVDMGKFVPAHSAIDECLALYRANADLQGEIDGLLLLARIVGLEERTVLNQQALDLAHSINDVWREARALQSLGWDHRYSTRGLVYWEEAVGFLRKAGDWRRLAKLLSAMANSVMLDGNFGYAQELLDESVELNRHLQNKSLTGDNLFTNGYMAFMRKDYEQARVSLQENIAINQEVGNPSYYLWSRVRLGYIALYEGDTAKAHTIFSETAQGFQNTYIEIGVIYTLEGMASLAVVAGKPNKATQLIGWADAARKKIGDTRPPIEQVDVDRDIAACRLTLSKVAFSDAYTAGRGMTLEQAVAYALEAN